MLKPYKGTGISTYCEGQRGHLGNIVFGLLVSAQQTYGDAWPDRLQLHVFSSDAHGVKASESYPQGRNATWASDKLQLIVLGTNDPEHWSIIIASPSNQHHAFLCDGLVCADHLKVIKAAKDTMNMFFDRHKVKRRVLADASVPTQTDSWSCMIRAIMCGWTAMQLDNQGHNFDAPCITFTDEAISRMIKQLNEAAPLHGLTLTNNSVLPS